MVENFLLSHHKSDIIRILENNDTDKHFSININFLTLLDEASNTSIILLKQPEKALEKFETSIQWLQSSIISNENNTNNDYTKKKNIHARVFSLPHVPDLSRKLLPDSEDIGKFLQITGTVVRMTVTKMLEYQKEFMCGKCKNVMTIEADFDQRFAIISPKKCKNEECEGTTIVPHADGMIFVKDYQEIKIQEQHSNLGMGRMPDSMWVSLEDDLVDVCKPGDDVTISGIVRQRWKPLRVGKLIESELVFKANHIQINNDYGKSGFILPQMKNQFKEFWAKYEDRPLTGRNFIVQSICPEIYGMYLVKLALALVLAGGSRHASSETGSTQARAESHMLLVGDPGMGKSQFLKFAAKIIPRSILTTGIGSTTAGLTATAVKEDGEWQLEGGALVLADGGLCCIDEFSSMKKTDRASIHEAMEQQTVSVAKAGVVCKLSTRCTVLAAMNPKVGVDATQPAGMKVNIASPLLSRFDVIFHLRDKVDKEYDAIIARHVLRGENSNLRKSNDDVWNIETLQAYFVMIKKINPVLTPEASEVLRKYYQAQRVVASRNKARTTVRLLDSLIRLSQAHAKLMLHPEVQVSDAVVAVSLLEASLQAEYSLLSLDFDLRAAFPDDPKDSHDELAELLLQKLKLTRLLENDSPTGKKPTKFFESGSDRRNDEFSDGKRNVFNVECVEGSSMGSSLVNTDDKSKELFNQSDVLGNKASVNKNSKDIFGRGFIDRNDGLSGGKRNVLDAEHVERSSLGSCSINSDDKSKEFSNQNDVLGNKASVNKNPKDIFDRGFIGRDDGFSGGKRNVFDVEHVGESSLESYSVNSGDKIEEISNQSDMLRNNTSVNRIPKNLFESGFRGRNDEFSGGRRNVFDVDHVGDSSLKSSVVEISNQSDLLGNKSLVDKHPKETFKSSFRGRNDEFCGGKKNVFDADGVEDLFLEPSVANSLEKHVTSKRHPKEILNNVNAVLSQPSTSKAQKEIIEGVFKRRNDESSHQKLCTPNSNETSTTKPKEIFKQSDLEMPKFKFKKQKDTIKFFEDLKKPSLTKEKTVFKSNESVKKTTEFEPKRRRDIFQTDDLEMSFGECFHKKLKFDDKIGKSKISGSNLKFDNSVLKENAKNSGDGRKSVGKFNLDQFRLKYQEKNDNKPDNQTSEPQKTTEQKQTKENQIPEAPTPTAPKQMHTENIFQFAESQKQTNEFEPTSHENTSNLEQEIDISQPQYQNKFSQFKLKQKKSDKLKKIAKNNSNDDFLLKIPSVSEINFSDDELADKWVEDGFNFDCESLIFQNTQASVASTSSKFALKNSKAFESHDEDFDDNLF